MEKPWLTGVSLSKGESLKGRSRNDGQAKNRSPIRKQAREDRRRYMREYMRAYRRAHPGLSTPYVRKFRAKQCDR